jgi:hypothetical protein
MTETSDSLGEVNEADAIEQAQAADGDLDDSSEHLDTSDGPQPGAGRLDADEADVLEQAQTIKPGGDEEYPTVDEV